MISSLVDTRYLEAFLAVCQEGTLGRAALRIHKTQPALSYNIQRLEEAIGAPLFERRGRRLILTAEGRRLRELGERYAEAFRQLRQEAGGLSSSPDVLRVATVSGFGRYVLYPRLRDVARDVQVPLVLLFRTAAEVFRMIEDGEVDCGAVYHPKLSNRLQATAVYDEELVLITPPGMRPRTSWRDLRTYSEVPFVTYEEGDYVFGRWFDAHFGRQPASGLVRWHVTELEEVIDAVAHGAGASIVPFDSAAAAAARVRIVRPGPGRCFNQVYRVQRPGSSLPQVFDRIFENLGSTTPGTRRSKARSVPSR